MARRFPNWRKTLNAQSQRRRELQAQNNIKTYYNSQFANADKGKPAEQAETNGASQAEGHVTCWKQRGREDPGKTPERKKYTREQIPVNLESYA